MAEWRDGAPAGWSDKALARRTVIVLLIAIALVALAALIWCLLDVLLLVFGSVLVAAILHAIADPIARRTPLSRTWSLPIAGVLILAVVAGTIWLFQAQVGSQLTHVFTAASQALPSVGEWIGMPGLTDEALQFARDKLTSGAVLGKATSFGMTALSAITSFVLVLFGGVYLAANPGLYRTGVIKLFPEVARPRVASTLDVTGRALKLWLLGQLFSMIVKGTLTWLALWLIGLPSALGLGLIAGVTEFIPLLGPFLGALPALLIAFSQGMSTVLWTALAFVVIQQVESNLIQPLITRRAVSIPPALLLFAVIAFGTVLGVLGLLLAAPLTVVVYAAVKKLYVRDTLGERTKVPGEQDPQLK